MDINKTKKLESVKMGIYNFIRPNLKQQKGQRIFRPFWHDDHPGDGCEIFVSRLPRDAFEGELIPIFASLGQIYECRLMMDFSGFTRGFCYVTYTDEKMAEFAVKNLHGIRLRSHGEWICCYLSLDNRMLFLDGLPTHKSIAEIERAIMELLPRVKRVILYEDPGKERLHLGVGLVEFDQHHYAANCRKYLWPARLNLWNSTVSVEWAIPLPKFTKKYIALIKNIDAKLFKATFNKELRARLKKHVPVLYFHKRSNYAAIQFSLKGHAVLACMKLNGEVIGENKIEVKLFEMTEEGEKQLMLEVQLYELELQSTIQAVDEHRIASDKSENIVEVPCPILHQFISQNNFPKSKINDGLRAEIVRVWNSVIGPTSTSIISSYSGHGVPSSEFNY